MPFDNAESKQDLLGLSLSATEAARVRYRYHGYMQLLTLFTGMAAPFASDYVAYLAALVAAAGQISAQWFRASANGIHELARRARRRALLVDAFGSNQDPLNVVDLREALLSLPMGDVASVAAKDYYSSTASPGTSRLRDHLQESAFWSRHLMRRAATRGFIRTGVYGGVTAVALLLLLPFLGILSALLIARILLVLLLFLATVDELSASLTWLRSARQSLRVDVHLESETVPSLQSLVATFSDYAAATANAPPIPKGLYSRYRKALNSLWAERVRSRTDKAQSVGESRSPDSLANGQL